MSEISTSQRKPLKVGDKFRHPFMRSYLCHVRGFVDDQVIARYWLSGKQRWVYVAFSQYEMNIVAGAS